MCSESYVQHIWQKHRLAIALAVLKEKPEDCTIDQYIEHLKSNISTDSMDDLDITICSEDFDIDSENNGDTNDVSNDLGDESQNSESILKYYPEHNVKINSTTNINNKAENHKITVTALTADNRFKRLNNKDAIDLTAENGMKRIDDDNHDTKQSKTDDQRKINKSLINTVKKDAKINTSDVRPKTLDNKADDNIKNSSNKDIQDVQTNEGRANLLQGFVNTVNNDTHSNNDTANTQESISLLNDYIANDHNYSNDKGKRVSTDIVINDDNVKKKRKFDLVDDQSASKSLEEQAKHNIIKSKHKRTNTIDIVNTNSNSAEEMDATYYESVPNIDCNENINIDCSNIDKYTNLSKKNEVVNKDYNNSEITANKDDDNAQITPSIDRDSTQYCTHVSQSQYENIVIDRKLIKSKFKDANEIKLKKHLEPAKEFRDVNTECNIVNDLVIYSSEAILPQKDNESETNMKLAEPAKIACDVNTECNNVINDLRIDSSKEFLPVDDVDNVSIEKNTHDIELVDDIESPKVEVIPFKVIEELNKVKTYLNRNEEKRYSNDGSIDSGYRSDSQGKSIRNSLQTMNWLNQSAHSLFAFMIQSSLELKTQQITEEISKVMSQLVDRLHDEEKYLSFLDELLEFVDNLLQEILDGDASDENVLLKKNEAINRLLLLNRSVHIQKYTISKITDILQSIYTHLTNPEDVFEINNTSQIENSSYIFHILEVILKRYVKHKQNKRVHTPSSQNELKKSSIVSIWRKKWYPHIKEHEGSQEIVQTKCVLSKCNDILNKVVVNCMDGYSLLSFAALQCFNLLQS